MQEHDVKTSVVRRVNQRAEGVARRAGSFLGEPVLAPIVFQAAMLRAYTHDPLMFTAAAAGVALVADLARDRHTISAIQEGRNIHARRARFKKAGKRAPTARALWQSSRVTERQRRQAWLTSTSERLGINPRLKYAGMHYDNANNELWDVRVPISPAMNPSVLARPHYEAGVKGCVKGTCYGVDINPSVQRGGIAHIFVTRTDIRSIDPGPAPILARYPSSIAEPVQIGTTATKRPRFLDLIERNGIGIFGMPGTGKSTLLHTIIAHCVAAPDAIVRLADLKDGIDGEAWEQSVIYTDSVLEVRQWIDMYATVNGSTFAYSSYATHRANQLKKLGIRKWEQGCGMDAEILIVDEIDNLTDKDQAALAWMTTKLRAIGVRPIIATQLPYAKTLDRRLSTALNVRIAFAVEDVDAAKVALGSGCVSRGYDPSSLPMPGYCLVKDAAERDASIVRTHIIEPVHVERIAKAFPLELMPAVTYYPTGVRPAERELAPVMVTARPVAPPPDDAIADPKRMLLWEAMPGARRKLCKASGFSSSQASAILKAWKLDGRCESIGQVWHHVEPKPNLRIVEG